jgi:Tol biopolymer transport system component
MALLQGTKLGPFEIISPLGAGGMGEVYRARDTRLDRSVAIKILPSHLSSDPDVKMRFEREAKAISSLSHPHICQLYDIGSQNGVDYLVMELLEGETLAARLAKGPLPLEQTLKVGMEIAEALDKAHRAGIVHRDLKPGNVMLTKTGAKLMDFGLAKAAGGVAGASGGGSAPLLSAAVTMTSPSPQLSPVTSAGMIVGTVQYMSPEQIEGKDADARSDIFALGAVLYEMITGKRAFEGKSQLSVASAIMEKEPAPISAQIPASPPALDLVIHTCLAKDPDARFQSAHDVMLQLRWIAEGSAATAKTQTEMSTEKGGNRRLAMWAACAGILIVGAGLGGYFFAPRAQSTRQLRAFIEPPENFTLDSTGDYGGPPVFSPQGDKIVFCAHGPNSPKALWVRSLDSFFTQRLDGTEGAYFPFWSPDGKFIAFFANGRLNRISASGGPVTALTDSPNARGGAWGPGEVILFSPDIQSSILRVGANGGNAVPMTKLDTTKHSTHRWPTFLPDGKHFLYLASNHSGGKPEENGIYFASLDGKENRLIVATDSAGEYASGYLLFHTGNSLMAQSFDPDSGKLSGDPLPLVGKIRQDTGVWRTLFTVSQNGLLAYEPGTSESKGTQLVWFDRTGKRLGQVGQTDAYMDPRLSPDGKRLTVSIGDPQREIWVFDLERGTKTRLTFQAQTARLQAAWSPDGKSIMYTSTVPGGKRELYIKPANGAGQETEFAGGDEASKMGYAYGSWSPDGQYFVYLSQSGPTGGAIYAKSVSGKGEQFLVVAPPSSQLNIGYYRISPNGHWVAYTSNETGRREIYIAPFPHGEGKWQISSVGADFAAWRGDSKEVFYGTDDDRLMSCTITEKGKDLEIGTPQTLIKNLSASAVGIAFDVTADGKRFLINMTTDEAPAPLQLVVDWTADLKKK